MEVINLNVLDEVADDEGGEHWMPPQQQKQAARQAAASVGRSSLRWRNSWSARPLLRLPRIPSMEASRRLRFFKRSYWLLTMESRKTRRKMMHAMLPNHHISSQLDAVLQLWHTLSKLAAQFTSFSPRKYSLWSLNIWPLLNRYVYFVCHGQNSAWFLLTATACHKRIKVKVEKMNQHGMHALYRSIKRSMAKNSASSPAISSSATSPSSYHWSPKEVAVVRMILKKLWKSAALEARMITQLATNKLSILWKNEDIAEHIRLASLWRNKW